MAARRAQAARASHLASSSNLAASASPAVRTNNAARLKATSMTNLQASGSQPAQSTNSLKRPASRNALDNIHKGMNAKFTHVQSKVLLQNIRPQAAGGGSGGATSKIPANNRAQSPAAGVVRLGGSGATLQRLTPATPSSTAAAARRAGGASTPTRAGGPTQSDRSQLINRIKALQEELAECERERDDLKHELERERADRTEQVAAAKGELETKALEAERQSEEYHQKLIEAYELADQNRRAADNVLSESRQREDELRKKIDELEGQLGELREFVAMKEEMMGKMGELREQIRVERERYEEKTRSLHQMFENEKIRLEMELMDKVKQVSESYELHKLKTQNRTIELDARLSSERLFAAKLRLHQANGESEKLAKQLRSCQTQMREQEKKLMLAETMLRQVVDAGRDGLRGGFSSVAAGQPAANRRHHRQTELPPRAGKLRSTTKTTSGGNNGLLASGARPLDQNRFLVRFGGRTGEVDSTPRRADASQPLGTTAAAGQERVAQSNDIDGGQSGVSLAQLGATAGQQVAGAGASAAAAPAPAPHQRHSDIATQTSRGAGSRQPGRARTIINDLRQRLNLVGGGNAAAAAAARVASSSSAAHDAGGSGQSEQPQVAASDRVKVVGEGARPIATKVDAAIQADELAGRATDRPEESDQSGDQSLRLIEQRRWMLEDMEHKLLFGAANESGGGRASQARRRARPLQQPRQEARRRSVSLDAFLNQSIVREVAGEQVIISRGWPPSAIRRQRRGEGPYLPRPHSSQEGVAPLKNSRSRHKSAVAHRRSRNAATVGKLTTQLRPSMAARGSTGGRRRSISVASSSRAPTATLGELQKRRLLIEFLNSEGAQNNGAGAAATPGGKLQAPATVRRLSIISGDGGGAGRRSGSPRRHLTNVVQYELAVHPSGQLPIVLPDGGGGGSWS